MKRRLVTLAAGASLLLCIATVALWVRSFWRADAVAYVSHDSMASSLVVRNAWGIFSNIGELSLMAGAQVGPRNDEDKGGWQLTTREADPSETLRSFARNFFPNSTSGSFVGFGFLFIDNRGFEFRGVSLPHWFVALATAVAPAICARGMLRARRAHRGDMCPTCGYDLRATPDRCPECGGVPASAVGFVPP